MTAPDGTYNLKPIVNQKMPFTIGDHVKPKPGMNCPGFAKDHIPEGKVRDVQPFDLGQKVFIEGHRKGYLSGYFDKVSTGDAS
jgi:hypothetical protein